MSEHSPRRAGWATFAVAVILLTGVLSIVVALADRPERVMLPSDLSRFDAALIQSEGRRLAGVTLPAAFPSPAEFAPFGEALTQRVLFGEAARGKLLTNLGHVDWDLDRDDLSGRVPERLRLAERHPVPSTVALPEPGLNYVQLDMNVLRGAGGPDAVLRAIAAEARIVGYLPDATLLVYVEPRHLQDLRRTAGVARIRPLEPYNKIALDFGVRPHINRNEASNPDILATVVIVPGLDGPDLRARLEATPGVTEVAPIEGTSEYQLRVNHADLDRLARIREVQWIDPVYEMMLTNAENAPTVQMGSVEDGGGLRPFDTAGVDGGGLDTNLDGRRINNGTDAVPPQIVAVADNGISFDTPSFSQTATQTTTIVGPIGPAHRKIHSVQPIVDGGSTCDAPLFGAGTHGTTVASAIAAYPSEFGVFARHAGIGDASEPRAENLDGVARGARILLQDIGAPAQCTINSLVERGGNVAPGALAALLNLEICPKAGGVGACLGIVGGGTEVHLAVLPFGAPDNFSTTRFQASDGTYPAQSVDVDVFLYNNRDYMIAVPVGNSGAAFERERLGAARPDIPDLFNGILFDDPPPARPIETAPPATAKNIIAVGSSASDCSTFFGTVDCEGAVNGFTSHGPATAASLRMAPILTAPGFDLLGAPGTSGVAVFRSRDNDNLAPIDAQLDEGNFGTSYAAAYVTGAAAVERDYFAQGFYPYGTRTSPDRVANVSGALVKALLAASADFNEGGLASVGAAGGENATDTQMRRTRAMDTTPFGGPGIVGNSEQGFGRVVLTNVLPLEGWPDNFVLHPSSGMPREYPAAGLLVWDRIVSGEPLIDNAGVLAVTHTFRVASPRTTMAGGSLAVAAGQLRIALAWPDPPSAPGGGGPLVNDLDLTVESPGPDNCLVAADLTPAGAPCPVGAALDNVFYYGNNYNGGHANAVTDQWSKPFAPGVAAAGDLRNPVEAVHLSSDPNNDGNPADSPLYVGNWRVTIDHGAGGAIAALMTIPVGPDPDEDDNANNRLDPGEDDDGNGLLNLPGQAYAVAVAGPVFLPAADPLIVSGPMTFPGSEVSLDRTTYKCADDARISILDITPGASAAKSKASTTVTTVNSVTGAVVDTETNINFVAGAAPGSTTSDALPVRLASPATANNGILEGDTGNTIVVSYAPAGAPRPVTARAPLRCEPDLINGFFVTADGQGVGSQSVLAGGCDRDEFLDAGEVVSYGVALRNRSRSDTYHDLVATLVPSGLGAAAVRVLDSPKHIGALSGGDDNAVFFQVFVDPTLANALSVPNRVVDLTLNLDALERGALISRQSYVFHHAINSDRQVFHYSTDYPAGGPPIVRDLNRNLVVDASGTIDPFLGIIVPDEQIGFDTLVVGVPITNTQGEDLNANGNNTDANEGDIIPNGVVDPGILVTGSPWNFDTGPQGWWAFRHAASTPGGLAVGPLWERQTNGVCGFQTMAPGPPAVFGIWHTGDGIAGTPPPAGPCDLHAQPFAAATPARAEVIFDILESPIVAKVHQAADARGFPYTVEFRRVAFNENIQLADGYAGGAVNIDNDVDSDSINSIFGQELDAYYASVNGGWPFGVFRDTSEGFTGPGINPSTTAPAQRTFAPPGAPGPLAVAGPDQTPYPDVAAPPFSVCAGGPDDRQFCVVPADCAPPGVCGPAPVLNDAAGPVRNFEASLIGYEGGFASVIDDAPVENAFTFIPGPAGNRWQIAIGFWAIESSAGITDYGKAIDDVVFEWNEHHPEDETTLGHVAACNRFGLAGEAGGGQCATLTVDRAGLLECDDSVEVTVRDAKCRSIGAGATSTLGGFCTTDAQCGVPGVCSAALPSVQVQVVTDSDSTLVAAGNLVARHPNAKLFDLFPVIGDPGIFKGRVIFSTATDGAQHAYTAPGHNGPFVVYYHDPLCDGDRDGTAGEDSFTDIDGDGVPTAIDDCPFVNDPGQADGDFDFVGDVCDVCPTVFDDQSDRDRDGVGDACDFDDIDFDGVENSQDNCPDVYNPSQAPGAPGRGAACSALGDRDGDLRADRFDNCVRTANPGFADADGDGIGDACDGDCPGAFKAPQATGVCSRLNNTICVADAGCPATGYCSITQTTVCTGAAGCPAGEACINIRPDICVKDGVTGGGACSTVGDDFDADNVTDAQDDCPTISNPVFSIGGTKRQFDQDRDGLGDQCDPAASNDDGFDLIPDDVVAFAGRIDCPAKPLPEFSVVKVDYLDTTGDLDPFPDTGETGNMAVTVRNLGPTLTDATAYVTSSDSDVACISKASIPVGTIPTGTTTIIGSTGLGPGFTFTTSTTLAYAGPPLAPPTVDMCITIVANETSGMSAPVCFSLLADVDIPPALQVFTLGADGVAPSPDDGLLVEGFDIDRDGNGVFNVADTFMETTGPGTYTGYCSTDPAIACTSVSNCPPPACSPAVGLCVGPPPVFGVACMKDSDCGDPPVCYRGEYVRASPASTMGDLLRGVACGGFETPLGDPTCALGDSPPFDWHFHCPAGAPACPNFDTGPCVGGCLYDTPTGGTRALSPPNSLHMGAHFDSTSGLAGDTTHLKTMQAYMSAPFNLSIVPRPGDLEMSFWQIVRLMDDHGVGTGNAGQCSDCADVQVQRDEDPNPLVDRWGAWEKLVPFTNVYDHTPLSWSAFDTPYCVFTPGDAAATRPSPLAVQETMCFGQGAWSHCGSTYGTSISDVGDCNGPGLVDAGGAGVWVQSRFNLTRYLGQRLRIRWIADSWSFAEGASSYWELGDGWSESTEDDGWWIDQVIIAGTITTQISPTADPRPPTGTCPAPPCNNAVGDKGTSPAIVVTDASGNVLDGLIRVAVAGQPVRVSAWASTIPGGCVDGQPEFEFSRNGVVVQPFSGRPVLVDAPEHNSDYKVRVRCSTSSACTSAIGASVLLAVYSADGDEVNFGELAATMNHAKGVEYFKGTCIAGTIGASCNVAADCGGGGVCGLGVCTAGAIGASCNVAADCGGGGACDPLATANDTTIVRWWAPGNYGTDMVRGTVPSGAPKGTLSPPVWTISGLTFPCALSNVAGIPVAGGPGSNYTSGVRTQATDPNPPVNTAVFYEVATNATTAGNINGFGCAAPNICSNAGWCELGTNAGGPCNADAQCAGGGYCAINRCTAGTTIGRGCVTDAHCGAGGVCGATAGVVDPAVQTFCSSDVGVGDLGGCSRHPVCVGGTSNLRICLTTTDCPGGGSCPTPAVLQGGVCFTGPEATVLAPGASMVASCGARASTKRLLRIGSGFVCP